MSIRSRFCVLFALLIVGGMGLSVFTPTTAHAKKAKAESVKIEKSEKPAKQPKTSKAKKQRHTEAVVSSFELEPPANPDYPTQLCGKRRERLVALQSVPWLAKPFVLGHKKIEHWQYRLCMSKTMPEVQRYLETFPVPYEPTATSNQSP